MHRKRSDPGAGEIDVRSVVFRFWLESQSEEQIAVKDPLLHDEVQVAFVQVNKTSFEGSVDTELVGNRGESNPRCQKLVKRNFANAPSSI